MTRRDAVTAEQGRFPAVGWGDGELRFVRGRARGAARPEAVIVLVWHGAGWLLADIEGRGWTTPSGHVEAGETPLQAARREAREEAGVALRRVRRLGAYEVTGPPGTVATVPTYVALCGRRAAHPARTEARAARVVAPAELPGAYYAWNPLFAAVFAAGLELAGALSCP